MKLHPNVKVAGDGEQVDFKDAEFDNIQVHVRHADDPFFYVEVRTPCIIRSNTMIMFLIIEFLLVLFAAERDARHPKLRRGRDRA